jgi:hypothetical protein
MLDPDKSALDLIDIIESGRLRYKLVTTVPSFAIDSTFQILENGNYKVAMTIQPEENEKGIHLDYFFCRPFVLTTQDGMRIVVHNHKVVRGDQGLNSSVAFNCNVEVKSFKGDADDSVWKNSRQRAYIKFDLKSFNPYSSGLLFDYTTGKTNNGFYNALPLKIGDTELLFYHERLDKDIGCFIIWPKKEIDFEKFQPMVSAIITAYGLLNGFYMLDTIYYITVKTIGNKNATSFYYENFKGAINSGKPILDSGNYADVADNERKLTSVQFNKLVNLFFTDADCLRSGYLLIEAGALNDTGKAAIGAVALETITKKMSENYAQNKIVKETKLILGIKHKLKKVIKEYANSLTKQQTQHLVSKIESVNNMPNSNKLMMPFDHLDILLSDEERDCIRSRNSFLHGNLPENKSSGLTDPELLSMMANRLVMLSAMLLLRSVGYNGYVIDRGITEVIKWRMVMQGQKVGGGNSLRHISKPNHFKDEE